MSMRLRMLVAPLLGASLGCGAAPQPRAEDTAAADAAAALAALQDADTGYGAAGNARDAAAALTFYAPDAVLYPDAGAAVTDGAGVRAFIQSVMSDTTVSLTFEPVTVQASAAGDLGYTVGMAIVRGTGPDGAPFEHRFRDVHVWRRQADGSWKIVLDIWNAEAPPASP